VVPLAEAEEALESPPPEAISNVSTQGRQILAFSTVYMYQYTVPKAINDFIA
jgi:hypothetical protein